MSIDTVQGYASTFVSILNSTYALNSAQLGGAGNNNSVAAGSSTFMSLQGLGGALRLFVAALWLDSTVFRDNFAPAAGGAIFFDQSCLPVCPSCLEACCDNTQCLSAVVLPFGACILAQYWFCIGLTRSDACSMTHVNDQSSSLHGWEVFVLAVETFVLDNMAGSMLFDDPL